MNTRATITTLVLSAGLALVGCTGQGNYTSEGSSVAAQKLQAVKAKTEYDMARQAFLAGNLERAKTGVRKSIRAAPNVAATHVLRARIQLERGNLGGALTAVEEAIELDSDFAEAHYFAAIINERLNDAARSLIHFKVAATLDPQDPQYATAAAELLVDMGQFDLAKKELLTHAASERSPGIRQLLGHIALIEGDATGAVAFFEEARLLSPNDATLFEELIRAQVTAGRYLDASENLTVAFKNGANEDRTDLQHLAAVCHFNLGRPGESKRIWNNLVRSEGSQNNADAWAGLARSAYATGDVSLATRAARRLQSIDDSRPEAPVVFALVKRDEGDTAMAATIMNNSAGSVEPDAEWFVTQALVQLDGGDTVTARETLQHAMEIDPTYQPAKKLLDAIVTTYVSVPVGP